MIRAALAVQIVRSLWNTHYGAAPTSKLCGIRISIGWTDAHQLLNPFWTYCKKFESNQLFFLYLLLWHGQSGTREIKLAFWTNPCRFTTSLGLQEIILGNLRAWTVLILPDVRPLLAVGLLQLLVWLR